MVFEQLYRGSSQQVSHVKGHIFAMVGNGSLLQFSGELQFNNHNHLGERCACALVRINSYIKIHSWFCKKFDLYYRNKYAVPKKH